MSKNSHSTKIFGRDINEEHRVSTPLELLFDLTFVISFTVVGHQFSHLLSEGRWFAALLSFIISMLAICWAWMNYAWFASAYDADDWTFRTATMIHMVGVVVLALGLPQLFRSIEEGSRINTSTMVLGYVIMRLVMIFLWIRAALNDADRKAVLLTQAAIVFIAQLLWTLLIFLKLPLFQTLLIFIVLGAVEFIGPIIFYRRWGATPWHAHHIAERYGLLAIISLGECVSGAVAMVNVVVDLSGWGIEPILIGIVGVGLTFGCWWIYFLNPFGDYLKNRRDRALSWGYFHILIFSSIVAMGAGLQVTGMYLGGESKISSEATLAVTALSVGIYVTSVFIVNYLSSLHWNWRYFYLLGGVLAIVAISYAMAVMGFSLLICVAVLTIAPLITIIGHGNLINSHKSKKLVS